MKLLVIRQQQLHVGLQQEADLLLRSPLALLLFLFMLLLLTEDGVQVLRHWQAHHEVCRERQRIQRSQILGQHSVKIHIYKAIISVHTNDCLSVSIPEAVQIVAVG